MMAREAIIFILLLFGKAGIGIKYAIASATVMIRGIKT